MSLPQFTVTSKLADNTQTTLSSIVRVVNSLISNLQNIFAALLQKVQLDSLILTNIQLNNGQTIIPHTLGRTLSGWKLVRQRGAASIYDNQDNNSSPTVNLILVSSAAVSVDIEVF